MKHQTSGSDTPKNAGDWPEDFKHENGNYANQCLGCGTLFKGNKHRRMCKVCATCPRCGGGGQLFESVDPPEDCPDCGGTGWNKANMSNSDTPKGESE
jgi:rRNA maturation endonuclease Nob1